MCLLHLFHAAQSAVVSNKYIRVHSNCGTKCWVRQLLWRLLGHPAPFLDQASHGSRRSGDRHGATFDRMLGAARQNLLAKYDIQTGVWQRAHSGVPLLVAIRGSDAEPRIPGFGADADTGACSGVLADAVVSRGAERDGDIDACEAARAAAVVSILGRRGTAVPKAPRPWPRCVL